MATEIILPRVDMDMATGKIGQWLAEDGARVEKGAPLFEIETDKAAMEIEAPETGILRILSPAGAEAIPVGTAVGWLLAEGEEPPAVESREAAEPDAAPAAAPAAEVPAPAAPLTGDGLRATPLARKLARDHGLDLTGIPGTGPKGRIQRQDVEAALTRPPAAEPAPLAAPSVAARAPVAGLPALRLLRDGTGAPLLLLHGFGAETASWRGFLPALDLPNPVSGLDLPAHGHSAGLEAAGFEDLSAQVAEALVAGGMTRLHLLGHSLGGAVAAAIAASGMVEPLSLTLIAPAGFGPAINGDFLAGFTRATTEAALGAWMRELVADPVALPAALVRATLRARDGTGLAAAQAALAGRLFPDGTQVFSVRERVARLDCPVRIIAGTRDRILPPQQEAGAIAARHLLPDVGHMPQLEAPGLTARLVREAVRSAGR